MQDSGGGSDESLRDARMVSFQIPAQWMPWIEEERIKRGLRTRSDFLRRAVLENIEIRAGNSRALPKAIVLGQAIGRLSSTGRRIRLEIHDSLRRGVEYFSNLWGLGPEKLPTALQLATRTYTYLAQEEDDVEGGQGDQVDDQVPRMKGISDEEKMTVLSSSGTAVKAKMGEIGIVDDPIFGQIPEVILDFDLTPEIEKIVFLSN